MNELFTNISIFVSSGLLLGLGLMLLFAPTADSPLLANYHLARRTIAIAYLFFAAVNVAQYLFGGSGPVPGVPLIRAVTLAIATSQAFLFTLALLALLETRFPGWRRILKEAIPALLLIVAIFIVYAFCPGPVFGVAFWIFAGLYALLLLRYTLLFIVSYIIFLRRMHNYYSGNEAKCLRWVAWSFFAALGVGIGSVVTSIFPSTVVALGFSVVFNLFCIFFAVRFRGYARRFSAIEDAMEIDDIETDGQPPLLPRAVVKTIKTGLRKWIETKQYRQPGINLGDMARQIGTNDKYLSIFIDHNIESTFRQLVNGLRVNEAKYLLIAHPDKTINDIARMVGFSDKSNFINRFIEQTHTTPDQWRLLYS